MLIMYLCVYAFTYFAWVVFLNDYLHLVSSGYTYSKHQCYLLAKLEKLPFKMYCL